MHEVVVFDGPGNTVTVTATASGTNLLLLTGRPIKEPVVFGGPFAMTNRADIDNAQTRFRRGDMGHLSAAF